MPKMKTHRGAAKRFKKKNQDSLSGLKHSKVIS
jgi:ribosomal protein L35